MSGTSGHRLDDGKSVLPTLFSSSVDSQKQEIIHHQSRWSNVCSNLIVMFDAAFLPTLDKVLLLNMDPREEWLTVSAKSWDRRSLYFGQKEEMVARGCRINIEIYVGRGQPLYIFQRIQPDSTGLRRALTTSGEFAQDINNFSRWAGGTVLYSLFEHWNQLQTLQIGQLVFKSRENQCPTETVNFVPFPNSSIQNADHIWWRQ